MPLQPTNLATFGGRCIQLATTRTQKTMAAHSCERIAKQFFAAAASNQQRSEPNRTTAALVRKNRKAILGGGCIQPAMLRSHKDPGSTLRKNRPSDSWRCCIQPAMLRTHSDNGSISWHNMSACTVSPGSERGQRSRIRQAPSSPHRRNRSRIFQGSFRFRRFRFHTAFP